MKKLILIILIAVTLFLSGCLDDNIEKPVFRLTQFNSGYTPRLRTFEHGNFPNHICCLIEYQNGKALKVIYKNAIGMPLGTDGFAGNKNGIDEYHEIVYNGNIVELIKKIDSEDIIYTPKIIQFTLDKEGRIIKRIDSITKDTTIYSYSENGFLSESVSSHRDNITTTRKFYFDSNRNLTQIREESESNMGNEYYVFEYFEGYDRGINGFKDLGIIEGAFNRSLSQNNFSIYSRAIYDNENILRDTMRITLKVEYDENGFPIYGDCTMNK